MIINKCEKKLTIYGLAYNYLFLQRKDDCSFIELNHLSFKAKYNLNQNEKESIWEHRMVYLRNRESIGI